MSGSVELELVGAPGLMSGPALVTMALLAFDPPRLTLLS
jgi:hypothetical protein